MVDNMVDMWYVVGMSAIKRKLLAIKLIIMRALPHIHKFNHPKSSCACHEKNTAVRICSKCGYEESLFADPVTLVSSWKPSAGERLRGLDGYFELTTVQKIRRYISGN